MKIKLLFLTVLVATGVNASGVGGHIIWNANITGLNGSGIGNITFLPPARSMAEINKGNVWVSYKPASYNVNQSCISWSGSGIMKVSYLAKSGSVADTALVNVDADFFFNNSERNAIPGASKKYAGISIESVESSGIKLINHCDAPIDIALLRQVAIGENRWDLDIKGTVPLKSTCSVAAPGAINLGEITMLELRKSKTSLLHDKEKNIPVAWQCSGSDIRKKITLTSSKVDNGCLGTDNDALKLCLFKEGEGNPVDMASGSYSFYVSETSSSANFIVVPGAGKNPQPGKSQGMLMVKVEPE